MSTALISVYDKTGIVPFAQELVDLGLKIVSTGGTARVLREAGLEVADVSQVTGFPECLDGRVKTLHPHIFAGILARLSPADMLTIKEHGIDLINVVVVNLYPFAATIAKSGVTVEEAIEQIDIGGPSLLRAAAKNYERVMAVTDPSDYDEALSGLRNYSRALDVRRRMMLRVFDRTSKYDREVHDGMHRLWSE